MEHGSGAGHGLPGRHESFWMETAPETSYPPLPGDLETDVAVVGGGITGITTAVPLKQAGYTVAVIEGDRISRGVTGHTTAKVTSLHRLIYQELVDRFGGSRAKQYADANQAAIGTIAKLARVCAGHFVVLHASCWDSSFVHLSFFGSSPMAI